MREKIDNDACIRVLVQAVVETSDEHGATNQTRQVLSDVAVQLFREEDGGLDSLDEEPRRTNLIGIAHFDRLSRGSYTLMLPTVVTRGSNAAGYSLLVSGDEWETLLGGLAVRSIYVGVGDALADDCLDVGVTYVQQPAPAGKPVHDTSLEAIRAAIDDLATYSAATVGPPAGGYTPASGTGTGLEEFVHSAFLQVLGVPPGDLAAVRRALPQRFERKQAYNGRRVYEWRPEGLVIETLLGATRLTGAQSRLYHRGERALDDALTILDKMRPLQTDPDEESIAARKAVIRELMTHVVAEFGRDLEPREPLVTDLLDELSAASTSLEFDLGYHDPAVVMLNLDDEEQRTLGWMFRDNINILTNAWTEYFYVAEPGLVLGTQLRRLSRGLVSVSESVGEVRKMLSLVRVGLAEQRTLWIPLDDEVQSMTVDDLLSMVDLFASTQAPRLIQEGDRHGVGVVRSLADKLYALVSQVAEIEESPFDRLRVRQAFIELSNALEQVVDATNRIPLPDTPASLPAPRAARRRGADRSAQRRSVELTEAEKRLPS